MYFITIKDLVSFNVEYKIQNVKIFNSSTTFYVIRWDEVCAHIPYFAGAHKVKLFTISR